MKLCEERLMSSSQEIQARGKALACTDFNPDDEDEQVSDTEVTCLNCRYRRWTQESFACLKSR